MKKRDIILNIMPFILWILVFVLELTDFEIWKTMHIVQGTLILVIPLIVSAYNTISSADSGEILVKNIFLGTSNIVGLIFSSGLRDSFVQPDPKADPVIFLFVVIMLIYMVLLTSICCGVKKLLKKR